MSLTALMRHIQPAPPVTGTVTVVRKLAAARPSSLTSRGILSIEETGMLQ
jgi:hypothetical protein